MEESSRKYQFGMVEEGQERATQQMQTDDRGFMKVSGEPLPFR